jgi:hypothetical protein
MVVLSTLVTPDSRLLSFGGSAKKADPDHFVIDAATRIIVGLKEVPLYARVDGIVDNDEFVLMELELIEPVLFLELGRAADRFAEVIVNSTPAFSH